MQLKIDVNEQLKGISNDTKFKIGGGCFVAGLMLCSLAIMQSWECYVMSVVGTVLFLNGLLLYNRYKELKK